MWFLLLGPKVQAVVNGAKARVPADLLSRNTVVLCLETENRPRAVSTGQSRIRPKGREGRMYTGPFVSVGTWSPAYTTGVTPQGIALNDSCIHKQNE